jgi:hypothetical protein
MTVITGPITLVCCYSNKFSKQFILFGDNHNGNRGECHQGKEVYQLVHELAEYLPVVDFYIESQYNFWKSHQDKFTPISKYDESLPLVRNILAINKCLPKTTKPSFCAPNVRYHAVDIRARSTLGPAMGYANYSVNRYPWAITRLYQQWKALPPSQQENSDQKKRLLDFVNNFAAQIIQLPSQISLAEKLNLETQTKTVTQAQPPSVKLFRYLMINNQKITKQYEALVQNNDFTPELMTRFQKGFVNFLQFIEKTLPVDNLPELPMTKVELKLIGPIILMTTFASAAELDVYTALRMFRRFHFQRSDNVSINGQPHIVYYAGQRHVEMLTTFLKMIDPGVVMRNFSRCPAMYMKDAYEIIRHQCRCQKFPKSERCVTFQQFIHDILL